VVGRRSARRLTPGTGGNGRPSGEALDDFASRVEIRMRFQELQDALRKQPFEPFRIQLSNGQAHDVRHPEFAALSRTSVLIGIPSKRDGVPDRFAQVDLLHVVAIEPVNGQRRGAKGSRKRRGE